MCRGIQNAVLKCKAEGRIMNRDALAKAYADRGGKIDQPSGLCWPTSDRSKCKIFVEKQDTPREGVDYR